MHCPGSPVCTRPKKTGGSTESACSRDVRCTAFEGGALTGIIAFRNDWIDQLYVLPEVQGCGVGSELLQVAKRACDCLQLWTFQRNLRARRFYEARGFALVEETDGARNEEKEPDARYLWTRASVP